MFNKSLLFIMFASLFYFPLAHSKSAPKEWLCKVKAFTDEYEALGRSKAEAKMAAQKKCKDDNNEMHCRDVKCEGPEPGESYSDSKSSLGWICTIKPFTESYSAAAATRAEAKLKVIKICEDKEDKMFCREPKCEEG